MEAWGADREIEAEIRRPPFGVNALIMGAEAPALGEGEHPRATRLATPRGSQDVPRAKSTTHSQGFDRTSARAQPATGGPVVNSTLAVATPTRGGCVIRESPSLTWNGFSLFSL